MKETQKYLVVDQDTMIVLHDDKNALEIKSYECTDYHRRDYDWCHTRYINFVEEKDADRVYRFLESAYKRGSEDVVIGLKQDLTRLLKGLGQ